MVRTREGAYYTQVMPPNGRRLRGKRGMIVVPRLNQRLPSRRSIIGTRHPCTDISLPILAMLRKRKTSPL